MGYGLNVYGIEFLELVDAGLQPAPVGLIFVGTALECGRCLDIHAVRHLIRICQPRFLNRVGLKTTWRLIYQMLNKKNTDVILAVVSVLNLAASILTVKGTLLFAGVSVVILSVITVLIVAYKMIQKEKINILFMLSFVYAIFIILIWLSTYTFLAAD